MMSAIYRRITILLLACFFMTSQALAFTALNNCCCDNTDEFVAPVDDSNAHHHGDATEKPQAHHCNDTAKVESEHPDDCCDGNTALTCACKPHTLGMRIPHTVPHLLPLSSEKVAGISVIALPPYMAIVSQWRNDPIHPPPQLI